MPALTPPHPPKKDGHCLQIRVDFDNISVTTNLSYHHHHHHLHQCSTCPITKTFHPPLILDGVTDSTFPEGKLLWSLHQWLRYTTQCIITTCSGDSYLVSMRLISSSLGAVLSQILEQYFNHQITVIFAHLQRHRRSIGDISGQAIERLDINRHIVLVEEVWDQQYQHDLHAQVIGCSSRMHCLKSRI